MGKRSSAIRFLIMLLATCLVVALTGCLSITRSERERVEFEGRPRSYRVHVPPSYNSDKAVPLVVALHGALFPPALMDCFTNFGVLSNRDGFIVVYPKGLGNRWNSDLNSPRFPGYYEHVDDVGFVAKVIEDVERTYKIDPRRVYVTGMSNGALLTQMVAGQLTDKIAAAASVAGAMPELAIPDCQPGRPFPILMINGTADGQVKWKGGALFKHNRGRVLSVDATVNFWVKNNGCDPIPETTWLTHQGRKHKTRIRRDVYHGKTPDSDVVLYAVEGGGHAWPGGLQMHKQKVQHPADNKFRASDVIWEFFKEHPRNE